MASTRGKGAIELWVPAVLSIAAMILSVYTFYVQLATANKHQAIALGRELIREFYQEENTLYRDIRVAIERCEPLYTSWGGRFTNDQINRYLGFFEDLGFYLDQGVLTREIIDHGFGSYIIEAAEHPHVKRYIAGLRGTGKQRGAFTEFDKLATVIKEAPSRRDEVELTRTACARLSTPKKQ